MPKKRGRKTKARKSTRRVKAGTGKHISKKCLITKLRGKKVGTKKQARKAFNMALKACSGTRARD
jgi:hypothetical protein